ncbi:hypothetical protein PoB_006884100 [Plakobranchus ocellatus]|uniref:Uncharacterized protein n=1 Tax=Plakobranchus ocellatus TaxID=259542 RepID=A0AAV4DDZ0_9GAST|nr:hypothetical protein PoB_006884100 [Plakobranchus ocellatus]
MSKTITPFASQNTVAITLAADLCTFNFLVTGEDGCFQVMESQTLHSNGCSAAVGKFFLILPTVQTWHPLTFICMDP